MDSNSHIQQLTPSELTSLVRKHTHDVHNQLNIIDLELTLLGEMAEDHETGEMVARLRHNITRTEILTRGFSTKLVDEPIIDFSARDLAQQIKSDATASGLSSCLEWSIEVDDIMIQINPKMMRSVLLDVIQFACLLNRHGMLKVSVSASQQQVEIKLEPRDSSTQVYGKADEMQKNIWSACRRLIEGNKATLLPETIEDNTGTFPISVTLPCVGCL